ncbi:putative Peroxyureidoacrylate/ureidoacrylate amidohydrolase RutB, partial [Cenococcum geophilum 1.58]|uniref:putative Peroxyureidoacrylate/ureidoacrylate amidohydrolase RutB n=1 Tax=Cenococcum geophilum 1.58 TaxID=794803 RepID=UPI00358E5B21
ADPYAWPHDASLSPSTTALIIIDMQRDFCSPGGYLSAQGYSIAPTLAIIPTIQLLLSAFRRARFPVYHTREGHRADLSTASPRELFRSRLASPPSTTTSESGPATASGIGAPGPLGRLLIRGEPGHDIVPELSPLPTEPVIDKPGRGAFVHTELEAMLRARGVRNLVVCGVTTDACVSSTVREASDRGFDVAVVGDACAAVEEGLHVWALRSVVVEGGLLGVVVGSEEVREAV